MVKRWLVLILCYSFLLIFSTEVLDPYFRTMYIGTGESGRILRQILENYDPHVRPKPPGGGPTRLKILIRAMDLMWRDDYLYLKGSYNERWVDERLKFETKSVHHKNLDTAVMYLNKSTDDQKSFLGVFTATDFGNDREAVTYNCHLQGCVLSQNDDLEKKVKNVEYWRTFKMIDDREYEIVNFNLTFVPGS